MDKKLKAKWVSALRSGQYPQGRCYLMKHDASGYCCLGVLCSVAGVAEDEYRGRTWGPFDAPDYLGVPTEEAANLATMNDAGAPFAEIADHIEKNL